MTHEMRRATWSGLDGRAVVRRARRRGDAVSAPPVREVASGSAEDEALPESISDPVAD